MRENEPSSLEETIAELYEQECKEPGHGIGGHGTVAREVAETILREGIQVNAAYGLSEFAIGLPDDAEKAAKEICHWKHKDAKFIVILSAPDALREWQLLEEVWDAAKNNRRKKMPARFMKGYFDVEKASFIRNALYESQPAPTITVEEYIAQQKDIHRKHVEKSIQPPPIPSPSPNKDSSGADVDIW